MCGISWARARLLSILIHRRRGWLRGGCCIRKPAEADRRGPPLVNESPCADWKREAGESRETGVREAAWRISRTFAVAFPMPLAAIFTPSARMRGRGKKSRCGRRRRSLGRSLDGSPRLRVKEFVGDLAFKIQIEPHVRIAGGSVGQIMGVLESADDCGIPEAVGREGHFV